MRATGEQRLSGQSRPSPSVQPPRPRAFPRAVLGQLWEEVARPSTAAGESSKAPTDRTHHPVCTPDTKGGRGPGQQLAGPRAGGSGGPVRDMGLALQRPQHPEPMVGALSRKPLSVVSSETTSRFQEQTCLLADMETGFLSSWIKPFMTSTEF